jgi:hypothetical protein
VAVTPARFRIVCATRGSQGDFLQHTLLGHSRSLFDTTFEFELVLFGNNSTGLPELYNTAIRDAASDPAILVFVHDDVLICDLFWCYRLLEALQRFQVVGLAGNRRRAPRQPAWCFVDDSFTVEAQENLSGIVGHGSGFPPINVDRYGAPGAEVKLLDGFFLAAYSDVLLRNGATFDERFKFHFYDMDFCRTCEARGLRMGTAAISVVHRSGGELNSDAWRAAYGKYLEKWGS